MSILRTGLGWRVSERVNALECVPRIRENVRCGVGGGAARLWRIAAMHPSLPAGWAPQDRLSRRSIVCAGALAGSGLTLSRMLRAEGEGQAGGATAKSCILLFQFGGPSHLDTFDPKPEAPAATPRPPPQSAGCNSHDRASWS